MSPEIIPTAEPFFFPGGSTGCLLIHGCTGAPKEMRWMGEYLHSEGFSVLGVRLFGHATHLEDIRRARWQDWMACVEDGWSLLSGCTDRIFVMGLSMGGILSLLFAARFPVAGVVAMSTPYEPPRDPRLNYIRLLKYLVPRVNKGLPDWHNPEAARDHVEYPYFPTTVIGQLIDLLAQMRQGLPRVTAPVLLINSREDQTVTPDQQELIYAHLGSQVKQCMFVEDSGHVITREPQRQLVFQAAADFIKRTAAPAQ